MAKIKDIHASQIFDSQANPTVETVVVLDDGTTGVASIPSSVIGNVDEAVELRDADSSHFHGMGVTKAIENVNTIIAPKLLGQEAQDQAVIDKIMIEIDASANKSNLGANAILSVSEAVLSASAASFGMSCASYIRQFTGNTAQTRMPIPIFTILEGGKHAGNVLNFQEFLIIPASSKTYSQALEIGVAVYNGAEEEMKSRGMNPLSSDDAGFSPELNGNKSALSFLKNAIDAAGVTFSLDLFMGVDARANAFYSNKQYKLIDKSVPYDSSELLSFYKDLIAEFALVYMEDPFANMDLDGWKNMRKAFDDKVLMVGDDLTTTNPFSLEKAIKENLIGGVIIKPSQIGTITEAIAVAEIARFKNLKVIVSSRSAETEDAFIADFAVGVGADYVKFGAPARERMVKYNRLLELETELKA